MEKTGTNGYFRGTDLKIEIPKERFMQNTMWNSIKHRIAFDASVSKEDAEEIFSTRDPIGEHLIYDLSMSTHRSNILVYESSSVDLFKIVRERALSYPRMIPVRGSKYMYVLGTTMVQWELHIVKLQ